MVWGLNQCALTPMKPRQCDVQLSIVAMNSISDFKGSFQFSFHFNRGLCGFVYNSIACHDICVWLMLHTINEALLLNNVWWVQALDNDSSSSLAWDTL